MRFSKGSDEGTARHQILCDDETFVSKVITGDESWIYDYDPKTKQQSSQWKLTFSATAPNFGDKRTGCYIMTAHRLTLPFSPGNFFIKNYMTVVYSPDLALYDFSVSPIQDKTERPTF
jgi:hypothetical protein